ncbi:hypothetical protein Aeqsu_2423 [Aequorivita sublithincola DSM 14238]|uniref:Uncharacterized protein n=1 Tax=Aequorivita sublithincola (strain DSM 14238 / LMG 21431 / ACAM 643 / 9-3) TaxID=746697 RepID=I3YY14_AEQSU|nr:hypothetical protein Aeqsu_2423 [Aequorivita sublithincola DSM 14238]
MANISYNQIHETLDEAKMALILQKIQEIADLLPKGTLTDAERKSYHALDVRNLIFLWKRWYSSRAALAPASCRQCCSTITQTQI